MSMMFIFNHGQPVLFYISPIFILGLMGKAYYDGCFGIFWNGVKIKKKEKIKNEENEESDEENEEEEDDEENNNNSNYLDKNKWKKFEKVKNMN